MSISRRCTGAVPLTTVCPWSAHDSIERLVACCLQHWSANWSTEHTPSTNLLGRPLETNSARQHGLGIPRDGVTTFPAPAPAPAPASSRSPVSCLQVPGTWPIVILWPGLGDAAEMYGDVEEMEMEWSSPSVS